MAKKKVRKPKVELDWMRAKKSEGDCAKYTAWGSRCRRYKVVQSVGKLEDRTRYTAQVKNDFGWRIFSRHRKRSAAERACVKHVNS